MIEVVPYSSEFEAIWDDFVSNSVNGTFLHTRKFLSYHGERFEDASRMLFSDGQLKAVFPAAFDPLDSSKVISHPGSTFGGLVCHPRTNVILLENLYLKLFENYKESMTTCLQIKRVPSFYERHVFEGDRYVLSKLGAELAWSSVSSTVQLDNDLQLSNRKIRGVKKSSDLVFTEGKHFLEKFWSILEDNLSQRYMKAPVHSLREIAELIEKFPQNIGLHVALSGDHVVGGALVFLNSKVAHAQYIASNDTGKKTNALDGLFHHVLLRYRNLQYTFFDFGISTENEGRNLNNGLYIYKTEFGSSDTVYETYRKKLNY